MLLARLPVNSRLWVRFWRVSKVICWRGQHPSLPHCERVTCTHFLKCVIINHDLLKILFLELTVLRFSSGVWLSMNVSCFFILLSFSYLFILSLFILQPLETVNATATLATSCLWCAAAQRILQNASEGKPLCCCRNTVHSTETSLAKHEAFTTGGVKYTFNEFYFFEG